MINTISQILGIHRNSYHNWKKQNRPIIFLLEQYFSKEDLTEYLETNAINKLEQLTKITNLDINTYNSLYVIFNKIDKFNPSAIYIKDGGKIIMYRILRDFDSSILKSDSNVSDIAKRFISHAKDFNPWKPENAINALTEKKAIIKFLENNLSNQEIYDLVINKEIVLPILKNMRSKINQKMKD